MAFPPEWLEAFSRALREADSDVCLSFVNALAPEFSLVAHALQNMVRSYQFRELMALVAERNMCKNKKLNGYKPGAVKRRTCSTIMRKPSNAPAVSPWYWRPFRQIPPPG